MELGGLPVETDVWSGVWISIARRLGEPGTVAALLPAFESYARVFHPAVRYDGDEDIGPAPSAGPRTGDDAADHDPDRRRMPPPGQPSGPFAES